MTVHASELAVSLEVTNWEHVNRSSEMNTLEKSCLAAVVFFAASSMAFAQAQTTDGKGCAPQERSNEALENNQSNAGVICPPEIDSGLTAPTPKTGDRSIFPPPAARVPGGDPSLQPKY